MMFMKRMNNNAKRRIWLSPEQQADAVLRYKAGETPDTIADSLGVCANNIRNTLRKHGVKMRDRSEARRRFTHREDAFDSITPESAYWIGFLFADGTIQKATVGSAVVDVALQIRDKPHLEKLKAFLQAGHKVSEREVPCGQIDGHRIAGPFFQARLSIRSQRLTEALATHGMRNKSLKRIAPQYLVDNRDFWRGLVDGDGYIGKRPTEPKIGLCGGAALMKQFIEFARHRGIGTRTTVRPHENIFTASYTRHAAVRLVRVLYENATIALARKISSAEAVMRAHQEIY